jgi:protein phosphatase
MLAAALENGGRDNVTLIIVKIERTGQSDEADAVTAVVDSQNTAPSASDDSPSTTADSSE